MSSAPAPEVRSACTYDCPDACGLLVRNGDRGLSIRGDPEHPITRGQICYRMRHHAARLNDPARLTTPRRRGPHGWQDCSWDEALELAAAKLDGALQQHGAESVVYLNGGGSLGLSKELMGHFFGSLGPVTTLRGGLCGEAGEAAQELDFGAAASHDYTDLVHARAVVLWGKNPVETGPHLVPFLREARQRGAAVYLVEPRHSESARLADRVITVAPGGDGAAALAVLRLLHDRGQLDPAAADRCEDHPAFLAMLGAPGMEPARLAARAGLDLEDLEALARLYLPSGGPTATLVGWGLQRQARGGHSLRCIDALGLLSGNVGRAGGGVSFTSWRRRGLDLSMLRRPAGRTLAAPRLGDELAALADPPARFVYVAGANPVTQCPDSEAVRRALRGAPFVVVADAFFTDTAEAADLVLPVTLMLEEDDVVGSYQHHHVAVVRKAVEPPRGARGDLQILRQLGQRLGLADDPLLAHPRQTLARITAAWKLGREGWRRNPAQQPVPFAHDFPTPSGKARLPHQAPAEDPPAQGDFPLRLISTSSRRWQTSQLPEQQQQGPLDCFVHPQVAAAAGLEDGAGARLVSPLGKLEVRLRLQPRMHPGTCVVHRGGWLRHGRCVNRLVAARTTDLGGGAAYYDQRVRLERSTA